MSEVIDSFKGKYRWLSNFWPVPVYLDHVRYPSVENAYQAAKTIDPKQRKLFELCSAGVAKKYGKKLCIRIDWNIVRVQIMRELLQQKFRESSLASNLKATGDAYLVEGNTWGDTFWGVCNGEGENKLGELLMEIRKQL